MKELTMCASCKQEMITLLDDRIRRTLKVAREEGGKRNTEVAQAECFHFMELQRILRGQPTCGVYDDFGQERLEE